MIGCFFTHKFTKWSEMRLSANGENAYQIRTCLRCNYKELRWV